MSSVLMVGLALVAASARAQAPDGSSPETAIPLTPGRAQSGIITGSSAGSFVYYWFSYPGDNTRVTLQLTFSPTHEPMSRSIGLTVWQGSQQLATMSGQSPTKGTNKVDFASDKSGPLLVQVYNYLPGVTASFELLLTGLPEATETPLAAAPTAPTPAPTPIPMTGDGLTPETAIALGDRVDGELTGATAGAFRYYTLDYPGDGRDVTLILYFTPSDSTRTAGIGLHVWQGNIKVASMTGASPDKGTNRVTFFSHRPGPILVQVFNYAPGLRTFYQVQVSRA